MAKKSEIIGEYILTINDDNSVNVSMIPDNTKEELRKIAKKNNIAYDDKLTTHQLGALILKELGKKGENTLTFGEYEIEKEPGGRINLLKTYGNTKEGLRHISDEIGFEYNMEWNTQQFGRSLMNFIVKRDEEVATTPANFVVNSTTTAGNFNKQFQSLYGGYLKIYNGRSVAGEDEKLVDLGAKTGEFSCRASRTVGSFVEAMKEVFNLKVKVWTADEWVTILDGITLSKVRDLPKQATKAVLEAYESYKRENKEEKDTAKKEIKAEEGTSDENSKMQNQETGKDLSISYNDKTQELLNEMFKNIVVLDFTLDELNIPDGEDITQYAYANFKCPGITIVDLTDDYGYDVKAAIYVTDDPDESIYTALDYIESKQEEDENFEYKLFQASKVDIYGADVKAWDIKGTIGFVLKAILDESGESEDYDWDMKDNCVLVRLHYKNGWASQIYLINSNEEKEDLKTLGNGGFLNDDSINTLISIKETPQNKNKVPVHFDACLQESGKKIGPFEFNEKYGVANINNDILVPFEYDRIEEFDKGVAVFKQNGKYGLLDENGKILIPPKYDELRFREGIGVAGIEDKYGYIDYNGEIIVPFEYSEYDLEPFSEELAGVRKEGKWGFVNKNGEFVIPPRFDEIESFLEGFANVSIDNLWGVINKNGEIIVPLEYKESWSLSHFSEGLMAVEKDGKYGYIDETGQWAIEPKFEFASDFKNGMAKVELDGERFNIDKTGNIIKE